MDGGRDEVLPGEEKKVEQEDAEVDHREPGGDAPWDDEGLLAEKKDSAQQERAENQAQAEQVELAGGSQGAEAGDDHEEQRDLKEMLDFGRRGGRNAGRNAGGDKAGWIRRGHGGLKYRGVVGMAVCYRGTR